MAEYTLGASLQKTDIKKYRKEKLKILKRDFCIYLTNDEIKHFDTLTTKMQIDQYCISMLNKYWG